LNSKNYITSLFITDTNIGIFCLNTKNNQENLYNNLILDEGIIVNGYIKNPLILYKKLNQAFKDIKIIPKELYFVFLGENILIRELTIEKDKIEKNDITDYLKSQFGITIHFPFENAALSYVIKSESDSELNIIVYIADKNLLEDYYDVLEKIGIRSINIHLLSSDINYLFNDQKNNILNNSIIVTLLENNITIHIIEDRLTIFGINDEFDSKSESINFDRVEDYINKISNYYQYNLRKGQKKIENVLIINLSNNLKDNVIEEDIKSSDIDARTIVLHISDINPDLNSENRYSNVAYISSVSKNKPDDTVLDFKIERQNKSNLFASYLFVLTIFIFAMVSLVYIPWTNMNQEIQNLENINNSLIIQKTMLEDNVISSSYSNYQISYNQIFENISELNVSPDIYLIDLFAFVNTDISILDVKLDNEVKEITLIISSNDEANLYEYNVDIFEAYGVITEPTSEKWMLTSPSATTISTNTMRVVIYYA